MKKQVMVKAWELAKVAVTQFGGKVSEYIGEALRIAWASVKKGGAKVIEVVKNEVQYKGSEKQIKWAKDIMAQIDVELINKCLNAMYDKADEWADGLGYTAFTEYGRQMVLKAASEFQAILDETRASFVISQIGVFRHGLTEIVCNMAWKNVLESVQESDFVAGVHYKEGLKQGGKGCARYLTSYTFEQIAYSSLGKFGGK